MQKFGHKALMEATTWKTKAQMGI